MNNNSCASCSNAELQDRIDRDKTITDAKTKATETKEAQAVCWDPINGYFFASAQHAIAERYIIKDFVSAVQPNNS